MCIRDRSEDDLLPGRKVFPDNTDPKQWYYLILEEAANPHEYQRKSDGIHESWTKLGARQSEGHKNM